MAWARAASAASVSFRLMKPGPAISMALRRGSSFRASATAAAISRGFLPARLAAASAPFDWKSARSGRSEAVTRPSSRGKPACAKAAATASLNSPFRSLIGPDSFRLREARTPTSRGLASDRSFRGRRAPGGGDRGGRAGVDAEALTDPVELRHLRRHVEADQHLEIGAGRGHRAARDDDIVDRVG